MNPNQDGTVKTNTEPPSHDRPIIACMWIHRNPHDRQSDRYSRSLCFSYDLGGQPGRHSLQRLLALFASGCAAGPAFCPDTNDAAATRAAWESLPLAPAPESEPSSAKTPDDAIAPTSPAQPELVLAPPTPKPPPPPGGIELVPDAYSPRTNIRVDDILPFFMPPSNPVSRASYELK